MILKDKFYLPNSLLGEDLTFNFFQEFVPTTGFWNKFYVA
jgi:hypothetical protein